MELVRDEEPLEVQRLVAGISFNGNIDDYVSVALSTFCGSQLDMIATGSGTKRTKSSTLR